MGVAMGSGAGVGVGAGSGAAVDVAVEVSLGVGVVWSQATSAMTVAQRNAARPNHALIGTPNAREAKVLPRSLSDICCGLDARKRVRATVGRVRLRGNMWEV